MKNKILILSCALFLVSGIAFAEKIEEGISDDFMRINVGLKSQSVRAMVTEVLKAFNGIPIGEIPQINVITFKIPKFLLDQIFFDAELAKLTSYVEEDYQRTIPPLMDFEVYSEEEARFVTFYPNDPMYSQQWGPQCIGAEDTWDGEMGNSNVIVAVVDTGIDLDHPDLAANVDTTIDYDFVNNDDDANDDHGHGTHVGGIIAAEINNSVGIAGLQQITLMAVKSLNWMGIGYDSWLSNGIVYAADNGARVINCSWGGYSYSSTIKGAVDYAFNKGVLVVAAAGNDGLSTPHYPSAYAKALGVAALATCTQRATWSNWGSSNVDLSAPGDNILSTYINGGYAILSGTSMAAPHVSGVAAAYFSYRPSFTLMQAVMHMFGNADDLGSPGRDAYYGYGRVDMYPFADK